MLSPLGFSAGKHQPTLYATRGHSVGAVYDRPRAKADKGDGEEMSTKILVILAITLFMIGSLPVFAMQGAGTVSGRVLDPDGRVVPSATVTLADVGRGFMKQTTSTDTGEYSFQDVPPGTYAIHVQKDGFRIKDSTVTVQADASAAPVELRLEIEGLDTIVAVTEHIEPSVSVTKLDVPLRDLPVTVNTVTSQTIAEQGTNDLVSALRNVNNVYTYTGYGIYEYYVFRGFAESVQLVDGVRNEGNRINTQTANIERIEVLKGPASVLTGNEATGGTVNLIRKKPTNDRLYDLTIGGGQFNTKRVSGGIGGPLFHPGLLYRLDAAFSHAEGWRHTSPRRFNVTPSIDWTMTEHDRVSFYFTYNHDRFATDAGIPVINNRVPDIPMDRRFNPPNDFALTKDYNFQWRYTHSFAPGFEFRDIVSHRRFEDQYLSSEGLLFVAPSTLQRRYLYFFHHRRPWFNQSEMTFAGHALVKHQILAGYEFQRYANVSDRSQGVPGSASDTFAPPIDLFNPVETAQPIAIPLTRLDRFRNNINAVYLQDQMEIIRGLHLHLSGRYDMYRRWTRNDPVSATGIVTNGVEARREIDAFTSRGGLVYEFTPWYSAYGSYSTSFRPTNQVQPDGTNLDPETGRQIEFGQRVEFSRRIALTNSYYELLKRNLVIPRSGGFFDQVGKQRSRGVELDMVAQITPNWHVSGGYGYTRSSFLYFISGNTDLSGKVPRFTPRNTYNLFSSYQLRNGFGFSIGGRYMDNVFTGNTNVLRLGGYAVFDTGLTFESEKIRYAINVNNIFDRQYFSGGITGVGSNVSDQLYPGALRNVMASITFKTR